MFQVQGGLWFLGYSGLRDDLVHFSLVLFGSPVSQGVVAVLPLLLESVENVVHLGVMLPLRILVLAGLEGGGEQFGRRFQLVVFDLDVVRLMEQTLLLTDSLPGTVVRVAAVESLEMLSLGRGEVQVQ